MLSSPANLLAVCKLLLLAATRSRQMKPSLINEYPMENNFSFVRLTCMEDAFHTTPVEDAEFMRNNSMELMKWMRAKDDGPGSIAVVLTQEREGNFSCSSNGSYSNVLPLAAQPADIEGETLIKVQVASDEQVMMRNLSCQIQPGQLKQSYRVTWKRFHEGKFVILSTELFNISLNLTQQNDSNAIYSCDVTVSHDGRHSATYPGGKFRILMTTDNGRDKPTIAVRIAGVCVGLLLEMILLFFILALIVKIIHQKSITTAAKCTVNSSCAGVHTETGIIANLGNMEHTLASEPQETEVEIEGVPQLPQFQTELTSDDDDNDPDSARVVSSTHVSDDVSFSPNYYDEKSSFYRPCFEYVVDTHTRSAPGHPQALAACNSQVDTEQSKLYPSLEKDAFCGDIWRSECINPHCKCQQFRMQELLKTKTCGTPVDTEHAKLYPSLEKDALCGDIWRSECTNPHCKCQQFRMQELLKTKISSQSPNSPVSSGTSAPDSMSRKYVLLDCTGKGLIHTDEEYGFIIEIPEGAIPEGMRLTIDIAISLYGPFYYPRSVQRISPIVWVCVRHFENFQFLKPVKVSLQHCLKIEKTVDLDSFGVRFLKASHYCDEAGSYSFQSADGIVQPGAREDYLTLSTTHFCYMCIVSNVKPDTLASIQYCLTPFHPQPVFQKENDKIHFYVSYFLDACLETINKQCAKGLKRLHPRLFSFTRDKCLSIQFEDPDNWILALESNEEITADDVDFQHKDPQQLCLEEQHGMYPPKFTIRAHSLPGAGNAKVRFNFTGGDKRIAMDILLLLTEGHEGKDTGLTHLQIPEQRRSSSSSISPEPSPISPMRGREPSPISSMRDREPSPISHTKGRAPSPTKGRTPSPISFVRGHEPCIHSSPIRGPVSAAPPLNVFMENVAVHARTKWRFFGIMIDIPPDILDSFPGHDCLQAFSRVYDFWLRRATPIVSWEMIASILESDTVDEKKLADDVRRNFAPSVVPQPTAVGRSTSTYSQKTNSTEDTGYGSIQSRSESAPMMVTDV